MVLKNKIKLLKSKNTKVGVIGLGYVGLPLLFLSLNKGFISYGFDIDKNKITTLNSGKSYINYIKSREVSNAVNSKKLILTNDFKKISEVDIILICVPTPLKKNNLPDLSFIKNTIKNIEPYLVHQQTIILESTTYPGTTRDLIINKLSKKFQIGKDFYIGYSPEREDPGNKKYSTKNIPKVIGADDKNSLKIIKNFYRELVPEIIPVSDTATAESVKLLENIFRSVNIALVNELKLSLNKMNIDIWEVINAAKSKPFGYMPFYPGPGLGGHCIPIDPFYFSWKAKQVGADYKFIELSGNVNKNATKEVIRNIKKIISNNYKKKKKINLLFIGVAYKPDVDDIRESPALNILDHFTKISKYKIDYYDPLVNFINTKKFESINRLKSVSLSKKIIKKFDATIIITNHHKINYNLIIENSKIIIDSRHQIKINNLKKKTKLFYV